MKYTTLLSIFKWFLIMIMTLTFVLYFGTLIVDRSKCSIEFIGAIIGGVLTLVGVLITLFFELITNVKNRRFKNKPLLYRCNNNFIDKDVDVVECHFLENTDLIATDLFYIKNSDHSNIWLNSFTYRENKIYEHGKIHYLIEKEKVICLKIFGDSKNGIILELESIDKRKYYYKIRRYENSREFELKEVKVKNVSN